MSLYNILLEAHSGIRWLVLLLGVITLVWLAAIWIGKKRFGKGASTFLKITTGFFDLQLLLGISLLINRIVQGLDLQRAHYEHAAINLIAIVLVHVAGRKPDLPDALRGRRAFLFLFAAMALIGIAISLLTNGWQF